jgi:hypothetical protein
MGYTSLPRLRPMSVGDLLDETFALYRRNFALFAGVVAVLAVPETLLTSFLSAATPRNFITRTGNAVNVDWNVLGKLLVLAALSAVISLVFSQLITGALAIAISDRYLGRAIAVGEAYASIGLRTFASLILAVLVEILVPSLVVGLLVLLALVSHSLGPLFALPLLGLVLLFLLVRFAFLSQVIVLERTGVLRGFTRSWRLVSGSWWRVFGIGLLVIILVGIVQGVLSSLLGALFLGHGSDPQFIFLRQALGGILGIFVQPITLAALTLLYYDLRIRKEGFDLELAAQSMDHPQPV